MEWNLLCCPCLQGEEIEGLKINPACVPYPLHTFDEYNNSYLVTASTSARSSSHTLRLQRLTPCSRFTLISYKAEDRRCGTAPAWSGWYSRGLRGSQRGSWCRGRCGGLSGRADVWIGWRPRRWWWISWRWRRGSRRRRLQRPSPSLSTESTHPTSTTSCSYSSFTINRIPRVFNCETSVIN